MKKISSLVLALTVACSPAVKTVPVTTKPVVYISEVRSPKDDNHDTIWKIDQLVSKLEPATGNPESKEIMYLNYDHDRYEKREVYKLQEPAVKIRLYDSDVIISLRDVYHDGNLDLEIREIPEGDKKDTRMKVYRDLFPLGSLDQFDECEMKRDDVEKITYYPCLSREVNEKKKYSFANLISRIMINFDDKIPASETDYGYTESILMLARSKGVIYLIGLKSPYR